MADAALDFDLIWASKSPLVPYNLTDKNILEGWNFIGSTPPARTIFDAWMNRADLKMQWLYNNVFSESSLAGFLFWRLPSTTYFVGEKHAFENGPLDVYIQCTKAGTTSADPLTSLPSGKNPGDTITDGTVTWLVCQDATVNGSQTFSGANTFSGASTFSGSITAGSGSTVNLSAATSVTVPTPTAPGNAVPLDFFQKNSIPVGFLTYAPSLLTGFVKANGATVSRADYPNLVTYANNNSLWTSNPSANPWAFGNGDGSTTMVLPDYRNRFIEGGDSVGTMAAGLPNITGAWSNWATGYPNFASGAFSFYYSGGTNGMWNGSSPSGAATISFSAQNSNRIYGASSTVQPPSIVLIPQIKY